MTKWLNNATKWQNEDGKRQYFKKQMTKTDDMRILNNKSKKILKKEVSDDWKYDVSTFVD